MEEAKTDFLATKKHNELRDLVSKNVNIFWKSFSSGPQAKVEPISISLTKDAKPIRLRLHNYYQEQRVFLANFSPLVVTAGMSYCIPTATWACVPLLVPKAGPSQFRTDPFYCRSSSSSPIYVESLVPNAVC